MSEFLFLFLSLAGSAVVLVVVGAILLRHWNVVYRVRGPRAAGPELKGAVVVLTIATLLLLAGASGARWDAEREARWRFHYGAVLTPNGTGSVRISLPTVADETLLSSLSISPAAWFAVNRTGDEPAIDVTLAGPTWLNATAAGTSPTRSAWDLNLTRTGGDVWCTKNDEDCYSEIAVRVLSGDVASVHVRLSIGIAKSCISASWELNVEAFPGVARYPGRWGGIIC